MCVCPSVNMCLCANTHTSKHTPEGAVPWQGERKLIERKNEGFAPLFFLWLRHLLSKCLQPLPWMQWEPRYSPWLTLCQPELSLIYVANQRSRTATTGASEPGKLRLNLSWSSAKSNFFHGIFLPYFPKKQKKRYFFQNPNLLEIDLFWDGDSWPLLHFKPSNFTVSSGEKKKADFFPHKATKYFHGKQFRKKGYFYHFPFLQDFHEVLSFLILSEVRIFFYIAAISTFWTLSRYKLSIRLKSLWLTS